MEPLKAVPAGEVRGEGTGSYTVEDGITCRFLQVLELGAQGSRVSENGGTGVGRGSASGTNDLNFWKLKRERESAAVFLKPGIWKALRINWFWAETSVSFRINFMMSRQRDLPLLIISTTAVLSE